MRINPFVGYGSHLPVLMKVMELTSGPVLELGAGLFSTPYLHWMCVRSGRRLVTYEGDRKFWEVFSRFNKGKHSVVQVDDWDKLGLEEAFSVALVDHSPGQRRGKEVSRLGHVDYVVIHDMSNLPANKYGYLEALGGFKYVKRFRTYCREGVFTGVLSNKHCLDDLELGL